jgi:hypothetical protein
MTWRQLSDPSSKTIKYNTKRWSTSIANEDQTRTFQELNGFEWIWMDLYRAD